MAQSARVGAVRFYSAGSVDVLHCYYAHGEENENFQRRSYWMLEEELSHIVLVHYREVKGNRTTFNRIRGSGVISDSVQTVESLPNSKIDSSVASEYQPYDCQEASPVTHTTSLSGSQNTEYEDAESDCLGRRLGPKLLGRNDDSGRMVKDFVKILNQVNSEKVPDDLKLPDSVSQRVSEMKNNKHSSKEFALILKGMKTSR